MPSAADWLPERVCGQPGGIVKGSGIFKSGGDHPETSEDSVLLSVLQVCKIFTYRTGTTMYFLFSLLLPGVTSLTTMAGFWEGTESFVDGHPPSKNISASIFLDNQGLFLNLYVNFYFIIFFRAQ